MNYQIKFYQLFAVVFLCFLIQSCDKDSEDINVLPSQTYNETTDAPDLISQKKKEEDGVGKIQEIYAATFLNTDEGKRCELFYSLVQKSDDVLEFRDEAHFNDVMECLEVSVEAYNDAFESLYHDLSDDEADLKEEQIGFYGDRPLQDFEGRFRFYSLRAEIEEQESIWLSNDILDDNTDPDNHFILEEEMRTLLTVNCNAKIGSEIIDFCYADGESRLGICIGSDCCHTGTEREFYYYNNSTRRYKLRVALRSYVVGSTAKSKIKHYKRKSNGGWKKSRTKLFAQVGGIGRGNNGGVECDNIGPIGGTKSEKRRKRRVAKHQWWGQSAVRAMNNELWAYGTADSGNQASLVMIIFGN